MTAREPAEDDPVTLKEACEIVFRGQIGPETLRVEASKGRLAITRIGRQDFTTLRQVREMVERCLAAKPRPASTSTRKGKRGLSETERDSSALAALNQTLRTLRAN
jgi:hypothetical protein